MKVTAILDGKTYCKTLLKGNTIKIAGTTYNTNKCRGISGVLYLCTNAVSGEAKDV